MPPVDGSEDSGLPDPLPPGYRLHARYVIESELAPQRMGRVYKASAAWLDAAVAVNVLARELRGKDGIRRFRWLVGEAVKRHRAVLDYGEHSGVPYAVFEYIEGIGPGVDLGEGS
jgi:hypothetical protein